MATISVENNAGTRGRPFKAGQPNPGFKPGQSGNPGGRPKGLAKRVRELVGEDGERIIEFMASVMNDETARKADRLEAAKWLADRGFGRAIQGLEIDVAQRGYLDITQMSTDDLKTLRDILVRNRLDADEMVESGQVAIGSSELPALGTGAQRSARR